MSIFKTKTCCCGNAEKKEICCPGKIGAIQSIKVLGAGCASCHKQYENATEAVKELKLNIEVEYVTDMAKIAEYGVVNMPAIVINEKVVSAGKVLKAADVIKLIIK